METATKTGIEKVEDFQDLLLKKIRNNRLTDDPIPGDRPDGQSDRQATAVESYIGSD